MDPNIPTNQTIPSTPTVPTLPVEEKKIFPWIWICAIAVCIFLLGIGFVFFKHSFTSSPAGSFSASGNGVPQAKVTDLSPNVPSSQKSVVLIEHSDSSMEKFIMQTALVAGYIKALPIGDRVISQTSAN